MKLYTHQTLGLPTGKISILRNQTRAKIRVLCLHGWLDNRASFLPMLPYLDDVECVAADLPGHGESHHRDAASLLHYVDYVRDIKLILDALGWDHCHLLGHSMGGALSLIAASALPDTILSLTMLDSLHPLSRRPNHGPDMLRRSLQQFTAWDPHRETIFPTLEAAVKARLKASPFQQTETSASLIMQYATEKITSGYRLRSDARLNFRSPIMLSPPQTEAFIQAVEQPVLVILGAQGIIQHRGPAEETLRLFRNVQQMTLEGGHHVHMDEPELISQRFLKFIQEQEEMA